MQFYVCKISEENYKLVILTASVVSVLRNKYKIVKLY